MKPSRRNLLKAAAAAPAAAMLAPTIIVSPLRFMDAATPRAQAYAPQYAEPGSTYLTAAERAFVEAAVDRIIPADDLGPGAKEAGVAVFIDRQLAGPFGRAETWYMAGPWRQGIDEQGYQLRMTPAELYRAAIRELDAQVKQQHGKVFAELDAAGQDGVLDALDKDELKLGNVPGRTFFELLVQNTVEGFFADPMYGGNRDFIGWKLIGFPGPRYDYGDEISQHGKKYDMPFVSIAGRDTGVRG
ncbi:MAG TPA: gluconate 2-dehydrogenase subunit 3 family protein [Burkholderiales bacterium]|nr:gluconate 2-dehydrogenase subunit 3 family protein [Burkholderiales bacterium]